jgi:hypothetical protein
MWGARHRGLSVAATTAACEPQPLDVFHRCAVRGCEGLAWPGGGELQEVREEIEALEAMDAEGEEYAPAAAKAAGRLESFCYACGSIDVMLFLLWETRSFWIGWADIIFGFFAWLFSGSGGAQ